MATAQRGQTRSLDYAARPHHATRRRPRRGDPAALPHRLTHDLGVSPKHHVEADADSLFGAAIGIYRMHEPSGEKEQGAVPHIHDDLVGVVGGEFGHWRTDDYGL